MTDYGLWNSHGGFWASDNPCSGDGVSRSLELEPVDLFMAVQTY